MPHYEDISVENLCSLIMDLGIFVQNNKPERVDFEVVESIPHKIPALMETPSPRLFS